MSDYTPTTDKIEDAWCYRYDGKHSWASGEELRRHEAEFDRWLEQVKQEARAEAWDEGFDAGERDAFHLDTHPDHTCTPNPYRQKEQDQ